MNPSRPPYQVIDIDGHVNERRVDWAERLPAKFRDVAPRVASNFIAGGERFEAEGRVVPSDDEIGLRDGVVRRRNPRYWVNREGMFDPRERLTDMDYEGIDLAVLFGGPVGVVTLSCLRDPELSAAVARAYNDWLVEDYCGADPARLKGVAALPMQHPEAAAQEVARAKLAGHVAVMTMSHIHGTALDHADFDVVWRAAEEHGMPVCVHVRPTETVGSELFPRFVMKRPLAALA